MGTELDRLRAEVQRLLREAIASGERYDAELRRRDEREAATEARHARDDRARDDEHARDMADRDDLHAAALLLQSERHAGEITNLHRALDTRDLIGQAKGIIMVTMNCTADEAFGLLKAQSQAENVKLNQVAGEIVARVARRTMSSR